MAQLSQRIQSKRAKSLSQTSEKLVARGGKEQIERESEQVRKGQNREEKKGEFLRWKANFVFVYQSNLPHCCVYWQRVSSLVLLESSESQPKAADSAAAPDSSLWRS